jgi:hypothetical protein
MTLPSAYIYALFSPVSERRFDHSAQDSLRSRLLSENVNTVLLEYQARLGSEVERGAYE